MDRSRTYDDLAIALSELRPEPGAAFAEELDERVAAGFPQRPEADRHPFSALTERLRGLSPQRLLFASGGTALAAIAIATVVVASVDSGSAPVAVEKRPAQVEFSESIPRTAPQPKESSAGGVASEAEGPAESRSSESQYSTAPTISGFSADSAASLSPRAHREIERSAEIGLLADPADVAEDSAQVFSAVHDARGIVLHSTTTAGRHAGADFDLLIPSARLGDALAAFSAIDEVRTRHEATTDITAPTVALGELLRNSRAKVESLLSQLAVAETESGREALELELRQERHHAAVLRARLDRLQQRTDYSRVSLRIETGASASDSAGGGWGVDDAFHDAGHILGIAAGVTLIALAVIAPLALIAALAWLAYRAWVRLRRERALSGRA